MANIRENTKNGKVISYRFTICLDRDAQGKQIRRYTTWTPPQDLTLAKAKKAAERAADAWELEMKATYKAEKEAAASGQNYSLPPEKGLSQILCKHRNAVQIEQNVFKAEVAQAAAALFSK